METYKDDYILAPQIVVTVPAYFNYFQKNATMIAAKSSFDQVRLSEPTSAALTYCWEKYQDQLSEIEKLILVYDLGGGTFDVSLVNLNASFVFVKALYGHSHLGGKD